MSDDAKIKKPEWKFFGKPDDRGFRTGMISSEALDGTRFTVFGDRERLYYGLTDATDGDPIFPGPYAIPATFARDEDVELCAKMIMSVWYSGRLVGNPPTFEE